METASLIVGIVGLAIGLGSLFRITIDLRRRARWKHVLKAISKLEPEFRSRNFDVIIGLADGLVPAAIAALNFRVPTIYFIAAPVGHRRQSGQADRATMSTDHIPSLAGKSVLLIDNHIYTGTNMRRAAQLLQAKKPKVLVTAALFKHDVATSAFQPDLFVYNVHGRVRSVPWSFTAEHRADYLS